MEMAHRVAYSLEHGYIPEGMQVLHRCDVRACCRPDHLFLGDNDANVRDKVEKGRQSKKLTDDEVRQIRLLRGILTQRHLALEYGVSQQHISEVQRGLKRAHVQCLQ